MYRPFVGARLPKHHFKADTNDMVRLGTFRKRTAEDQSKIALIVMELMFGNLPTILRGQSTVLYTFYPPLKAHPLFYIGATLLVIGSWIWGGVMIASYRSWRRDHPGEPIPLPIHGMLATIIIWYLATVGLAIEVLAMLIPWSLGWMKTVDPLLARTYFWWFGHPLVYFWLIPHTCFGTQCYQR